MVSIRGNAEDPLSRGHICPKGVALADVYEDPDRLRKPVRKVGDEWVEVSWDEALDLTADGLARVGERARPRRRGRLPRQPQRPLAGRPDSTASAMIKTFRTRNNCSAPAPWTRSPTSSWPAQLFGHQLADPDRRTSTGPPTSWCSGANPMASNGIADDRARLPQPAARAEGSAAAGWSCSTRAARRPRRSPTSTTSSVPATDAVVLLSMLHVLFEEGLTVSPVVRPRDGVRCGSRSPTSPRSTPPMRRVSPADSDPTDHA